MHFKRGKVGFTMTEKHFKQGEVIFREGEQGESLYYVVEGSVGIYADYGEAGEQLLTTLKKDDCFGEMAVIEAYPRSATAVALDPVTAFEVSSGEINEYFKKEPEMVTEIMRHLSSRIRELTKDYTEVSATIEELTPGDSSARSESLLEKIRKFAKVASSRKSVSNIESVESARRITAVAHSEGYTGSVENFSKGTVIFKEGETGNCMYDIHYGTVGVYKGYGTADEKLLTKLSTNNFFGEMGMLDAERRSATAVVLEDNTTLETITAKDLKDLFEKNPPKLEMIMAHMSYRLRKLTNEYVKACKLVYDLSEAEASGNVSDEIKDKADNYQTSFYD